jgi:hypothetical protein
MDFGEVQNSVFFRYIQPLSFLTDKKPITMAQ